MLHEIKVLEINANLIETTFEYRKLTRKRRQNFIIKEINAIKTVGGDNWKQI